MGDRASEFCPEFFGEASPSEYGSNSFANRSVCPFRHPVLFGCVRCCLLVMNAEFLAQFRHLFAVLPSSVRSNGFDSTSVLFEDIPEFEEAFTHLLCQFRL